jgi:hypothetical protein
VGIGTASPAFKLDVSSSAKIGGVYNDGLNIVVSGNKITYPADNTLAFSTNSAERMRIDSSGNVGIGTSSPTANLHVRNTGGNATFKLEYGAGGTISQIIGANSEMSLQAAGASSITAYTNATERMRIDSSGNLLVGNTVQLGSGKTCISFTPGVTTGLAFSQSIDTSAPTPIIFLNAAGSSIGSVATTATTTTYATSSDYRLKNTIAPMTGALDKVALLKPVTYKWNADNSDGQGFIAHELQEVCPQAVTGEKDAVDAEGKPQYQGIDTSFLVATLTAAIQELKAIVDAQAVRIAALEV